MLKKLVPIAGDMTKHNVGLEKEMADVLINEVDIIASSAANTTFDERFLQAPFKRLSYWISICQFENLC